MGQRPRSWATFSTVIAIGNASLGNLSCTTARMVWFGLEKTRALQMGVIIRGDMRTSAKIRIWQTLPRVLNTVTGCQKHPLCKDDANGNVPLGKSCNRYWACQGGYPRLQRCPAMLVFDKNRRRCVTPPTEDCEVPTTKAPPPGEENFSSGSGSRGSSG